MEIYVCVSRFLYLLGSFLRRSLENIYVCTIQVGSDSMQGAGAPTMFQAMRRIIDSLMHQSMGEGALERAIHSSFLGKI